MYTQKIECPVCGRKVGAYRPEFMPPDGRLRMDDAHKRGENVGWLTPYRHQTRKGSGVYCIGHLNHFLLPYRPITEESGRGLYFRSYKFRYENPRLWLRDTIYNRFVVNANRED